MHYEMSWDLKDRQEYADSLFHAHLAYSIYEDEADAAMLMKTEELISLIESDAPAHLIGNAYLDLAYRSSTEDIDSLSEGFDSGYFAIKSLEFCSIVDSSDASKCLSDAGKILSAANASSDEACQIKAEDLFLKAKRRLKSRDYYLARKYATEARYMYLICPGIEGVNKSTDLLLEIRSRKAETSDDLIDSDRQILFETAQELYHKAKSSYLRGRYTQSLEEAESARLYYMRANLSSGVDLCEDLIDDILADEAELSKMNFLPETSLAGGELMPRKLKNPVEGSQAGSGRPSEIPQPICYLGFLVLSAFSLILLGRFFKLK